MQFSIKRGSRLSLKERTKWGFNPCAFQIRWTLAELKPTSAAILRVLQWVALAASLQSAFHHFPHFAAFNLLFTARTTTVIEQPFDPICLVASPPTSDGWNGVPSCGTIWPVVTPRALSKMIRALRASFCGVFPFRTMLSNSMRSFSGMTILLLVLIPLSISFITLYVYHHTSL